ncbi:phage tail sheath C-terminal domain-containing protein [Mesorhizobium sp. M0571]|uniref:phage tail sheath C-terminal domain-containing protein n=1 Tax=Mesorhizobium sp. M0571 TaxID=2956960 RepID=UPI00333982C1
MPIYQHPGVYIEEIPGGARAIESAGTSTAVIIGYATKGPMKTPTLLFKWDQYADQFGGIGNFFGLPKPVHYMGHAVQAFFDNGGGKAYIVRLATGALKSSAKLITAPANATVAGDIQNYLNIKAASEGVWADGLAVELSVVNTAANPPTYRLAVGRRDQNDNLMPQEVFSDLTLVLGDRGFIADVVNKSSGLIEVEPVAFSTITGPQKIPFYIGRLTGADLSTLTPTDIIGLVGRKLIVTLDAGVTGNAQSNSNIEVELTATEASLALIAARTQVVVRGGTATTAKSGFTAEVSQNRLVLTSGTKLPLSSVAISAGTPDAAEALKLTGAGVVAKTGEQSFFDTFSPKSPATLSGGSDGLAPASIADYEPVFAELRKFRDVNIVLIPDHQWATDPSKAVIGKARDHAESVKTCMVLIDPPPNRELTSESDVASLGLPTSIYTTLYYPWVFTANPHYHPELRPNLPATYLVPPSGFAAGMWARIDARRGVWKAPAGLATGLSGVARTEFKVGNDEQDGLNPSGVNCFRTILSEPVIWGSRTLATKADPEWRYVPVRRTALMIEESIFQGIQWAVFEPNDHNLWASLRVNVGAFMDGLHRAGAFQGQKASDAYFVRCGLGDTMVQGDIDGGRVIVVVGFAPLKPAEFVIVRIQQKVAQQ